MTPAGQVIDFLQWDVVTFVHTCSLQDCIENHPAGSAISVSKGMQPIQNDVYDGGFQQRIAEHPLTQDRMK